MITMIAIGIQNPADGRRVTNHVPFYQGFGAMMSIVFSFGMSLPFASRQIALAAHPYSPIHQPSLQFLPPHPAGFQIHWLTATAGHVSFFGFISEMKNPKDFKKTLYALQFTDTTMYLVTAVVIYYYGGDSVTSPALGSTGPLVSKIAYGIAIPTVRQPHQAGNCASC